MPRIHQTLLVPGERITAAEVALAGGPIDGPEILAGPFEIRFNDGHRFAVTVTNSNPPQLTAELYDQNGTLVDTEQAAGCIDQDYILTNGDATYEVSILRAANTTLTGAAVTAYNAGHGRHCPACKSPDIHGGPPQIDGPTAWVRVECCSCNARWKDLYTFSGISTAQEDWDPPEQNVRQANA